MHNKSGVLLLIALLLAPTTLPAEQKVLGWIEKVRLYPGNLVVKAKFDTGAKTSSLHCQCSKVIKRNGERWLRFTIQGDYGKTREFFKKIVRTVKIRRHFRRSQKRHVVEMDVCIAGLRKTIEVSVIDRSGFNYKMLIGRRAMEGQFLIDSGRAFTTRPICK